MGGCQSAKVAGLKTKMANGGLEEAAEQNKAVRSTPAGGSGCSAVGGCSTGGPLYCTGGHSTGTKREAVALPAAFTS